MEEGLRKFALTENGIPIHIDSVEKGKRYFCLGCNSEVIAKRGDILQHHFAHKSLSELNDRERKVVFDCIKSNESYLHNAFKSRFYQILKEKIKKHEDYIFCYTPSNLGKQKGNLLKTASGVELEKYVQGLKPDLTLYDRDGKPYVAIEIVVDNKPDRKKLAYYSKNNILLYEIDLEKNNFDVLDDVIETASRPTVFSFVPDPKKDVEIPKNRICEKCGGLMPFSYINITEVLCPQCKTANRFAYRSLTNKEGKNIRYFFDKYTTISEKSIFDMHGLFYNKENCKFICENPLCGRVLYLSMADVKEKETYPLGYFCPKCQGKIKEGVVYKSQRFQNHAELRWASFFDDNGIEYEYNPQNYRFSDINPFPVFYLKKTRQIFRANRYVHFEKDFDKAQKLFNKTGVGVVIGFENGCFCVVDEYGFSNGENSFLAQCRKCQECYFITNNGDWTCKHCGHYDGDCTYDYLGDGGYGVF